MRPKHNDDRVIKRLLPWVLLLAAAGILYYLYAPYQDAAGTQNVHDTVSTEQSLTDETAAQNDGMQDSDNPQNTDNEPADADTETQSRDSAETDRGGDSTAQQAEDNSTDAADSEPPADTAAQDEDTAGSAADGIVRPKVQDNTPGIFVKRVYSIGKTNNAWTSLQQSAINPELLKQMQGLQKKLSGPFTAVDVLYSDYERGGKFDPVNSKVLAVRTDKWTYFSKESGGKTYFYDRKGQAPEFAMSRVPFNYQRISSPFNPNRIHPITRRIRPHLGVDLKGAYGTAIPATGNGIVTYAGWQSGYGRIVIINHENGYETRYAHLSAIDTSAGQRVTRGQIIGRLGNSGASTGAHLHYEVRINGTPYDPMTVSLPSYQPLPQREMKTWKQYASLYLDAIDDLKKK